MSTSIKLKANGKLLISGEYLVMNGAKALAFPICFGQDMTIEMIADSVINWKSTENNQEWFTASFKLPKLSVIKSSDMSIAKVLEHILQAAQSLNPQFIFKKGCLIEINANYPLKWGFGSSSTLISLIARWANINEYSLYKMVSNGSGYDVACATQQTPIFYQLIDGTPVVTKAEFGNAIKNHCLFAYLGNKQSSNEEINNYKEKETPSQIAIERISELTDNICKANNVSELIENIREHEEILSSILNRPTLAQDKRFLNFNGAVKSLGAWGGDFAICVADKPISMLREELKQLGITTMFSYDELRIKA
jgi:mevalonate kinase